MPQENRAAAAVGSTVGITMMQSMLALGRGRHRARRRARGKRDGCSAWNSIEVISSSIEHTTKDHFKWIQFSVPCIAFMLSTTLHACTLKNIILLYTIIILSHVERKSSIDDGCGECA